MDLLRGTAGIQGNFHPFDQQVRGGLFQCTKVRRHCRIPRSLLRRGVREGRDLQQAQVFSPVYCLFVLDGPREVERIIATGDHAPHGLLDGAMPPWNRGHRAGA